jgi:hypothetical protein
MKTGAERGELVTLLAEPYLDFLFNYLPSPPSGPAVGAMSVVVSVAYIAAVVQLSLAATSFFYFKMRGNYSFFHDSHRSELS